MQQFSTSEQANTYAGEKLGNGDQQINSVYFSKYDTEAETHYHQYGWVIIRQRNIQSCCSHLYQDWQAIGKQHAQGIGCSDEAYKRVISQWRHLWKESRNFKSLMTESLAEHAGACFALDSVRLLHDHVICKTAHSANGVVPWHQDSMYWPVDRTGMSTWLPLVDVPVEHGCLEVVSGSHKWKPSSPVDFMGDENPISDETETILLPAQAGDLVLLHSRTWHRSLSTELEKPRPVYISLWIPPGTRYYKKNAAWHPLNEQISVNEGELLNEDEFPVFGATNKLNKMLGNSLENKHDGVKKSKGMFGANERIMHQIQAIMCCKGSIDTMISKPSKRRNLLSLLMKKFPHLLSRDIEAIIEDVWISAAAYEKYKDRNVFNSAYLSWENMFALHDFIAMRSVDGDTGGNNDAIAFIHRRLKRMDFKVEIKGESKTDQPCLIAHFPGRNNQGKIALYGHYDVVRVDESACWKSGDPFVLKEIDGRYFGRGIADNKGSLFARLLAVENLIASRSAVPEILWLIQGEEEITTGTRVANFYFQQAIKNHGMQVFIEETGFNDMDKSEQIVFLWSPRQSSESLQSWHALLQKSLGKVQIEYRHLRKFNGGENCPLLGSLPQDSVYIGFGPNDKKHQIHRDNESIQTSLLRQHVVQFESFLSAYATYTNEQ